MFWKKPVTNNEEIKQNIQNIIDMLKNRKSSETFLRKAMDSLHKSAHDLKLHLTNKNWKLASISAHRLRGTANHYTSTTLQQCLEDIDNGQINQQNLQETLDLLDSEFNLALKLIASAIEQQSNRTTER
jgi:hypothetical protein